MASNGWKNQEPESCPPKSESDESFVTAGRSETRSASSDEELEAPEAVSTTLETQEKPKKCNSSRRSSTLELRRIPMNSVLFRGADMETCSSVFNDESKQHPPESLLRRLCLSSKYSLRTQLMLSFGIISALGISFIAVTSLVIAFIARDHLVGQAQANFESQSVRWQHQLVQYAADALTGALVTNGAVEIIREATLDRFVGYPDHPGYATDESVPFRDVETSTRKYPIRAPPLPLDWQIVSNVNEANAKEHIMHRWSWYESMPGFSTSSATYYMQGMCDPSVTDPNSHAYLPGCTDANNNITTGGVIAPTPTNQLIYDKAGDLEPLLKAIYEYHNLTSELGVYFANGGAGATLSFPHYELDSNSFYVSIGCEWMNTPNPLDPSRPIGTTEEIQRCHPSGTVVSAREYNPMERAWCRDQALDPFHVKVTPPYFNAWNDKQLVLTAGQAVYDRLTKNFIACTVIDPSLEEVQQIVEEATITEESQISVVQYASAATILASSAWDVANANFIPSIHDLDVGVSEDLFSDILNLVDFDTVWDPVEAQEQFRSFHAIADGFSVTAWPIPSIPRSYDELYKPKFLVISSVYSELDYELRTNEMADEVNRVMFAIAGVCILVGFGGFALVQLFICLVSNQLMSPLTYMNSVAKEIVENMGETGDSESRIEIDEGRVQTSCAPRTELNEVVAEFCTMAQRFGGSDIAKSMIGQYKEVENRFVAPEQLVKLYQSREDPEFRYAFSPCNEVKDLITQGGIPKRASSGSNVFAGEHSQGPTINYQESDRSFSSPLFFWILAIVVMPFLLTTLTLSIGTGAVVSLQFPNILDSVKTQYLKVERNGMASSAVLRSQYISDLSEQALRDLHILTRYSSWLLFGGLNRTDSFTELITGVEECKDYANIEDCPYYLEKPCDCSWNDVRSTECRTYGDDFDVRYLQQLTFTCEANDASPIGNRNSSSFPDVSFSPSSTLWWSNLSELPGVEKGSSASGHETIYDRLRVLSAVPIMQPLYNKDRSETQILLPGIGLEEDGCFISYEGCNFPGHAGSSRWQSSESNGAEKLRPELCPVGKHGYDPRCRGWYDTGRKRVQANEFLYITPPYEFASSKTIAQSATAPLVDPVTKEHVGQVLIDFMPELVLLALEEETPLSDQGFRILITPVADVFGADTVVGPNLTRFDPARPSIEVLAPYMDDTSSLDDVIQQMKEGRTGITELAHTNDDGEGSIFHLAYAPVTVKFLHGVDSSDFSRGVQHVAYVVYSLALAQSESEMLVEFEAYRSWVRELLAYAFVALGGVVVFTLVGVIYFAKRVAVSITHEMFYLLDLVRGINRIDVNEEPPEADPKYGSYEIKTVSDTMESLYKLVRSGNTAFFVGNLEKAYVVLRDGLRLFTRLDNPKAIGIASNNLGNVMLAFYRTMKEGDRICELDRRNVVAKGMAYFHRAIQVGEKSYDDFYEAQGWTPECLDFMQHLSNRYFNRGMFLLTVRESHQNPKEVEELGLRDIQIARDMDVEIVDQGTEVGWQVNTPEKMFKVALSRINGHLLLLEMGYPDNYDLDEVIHNTFDLVKKEKTNPSSPLFLDVSESGRMQEIEAGLITYKLIKGDVLTAARVAIRMMIEDDFAFVPAQEAALRALSAYAESLEGDVNLKRHLLEYKQYFEEAVEDAENAIIDAGNDEVESTIFELSARKIVSLSIASEKQISSLRASNRGDVTMEVMW